MVLAIKCGRNSIDGDRLTGLQRKLPQYGVFGNYVSWAVLIIEVGEIANGRSML
jgi:hypothetical protein